MHFAIVDFRTNFFTIEISIFALPSNMIMFRFDRRNCSQMITISIYSWMWFLFLIDNLHISQKWTSCRHFFAEFPFQCGFLLIHFHFGAYLVFRLSNDRRRISMNCKISEWCLNRQARKWVQRHRTACLRGCSHDKNKSAFHCLSNGCWKRQTKRKPLCVLRERPTTCRTIRTI